MRDSAPGPCSEGDRGQSELVGFLLVFSVVILTIALVGLTGFVGLDGAKDFQRSTNAEQAFTELADSVDDVVRAGAPSRSTEVRIADGRLSLETAEMRIRIDGADGNSTNVTVANAPVVYDSGTGTTITYRSGALIRQDGDAAVMFREPDFVLTDERVILPVVETTQASGGPVGGTSAVEVRTTHAGTDLVAQDRPVTSITLNITTPNADVWVRYFEAAADDGPVTNVERDGDTVEVTLEPERATVTVHRVDVTFR
jgi:hypothetical protein